MPSAIWTTTIKDGRPNLPPEYSKDGLQLCNSEGQGYTVNEIYEDGTCKVTVETNEEVIEMMKTVSEANVAEEDKVSKAIPEGKLLAHDYEWVEDVSVETQPIEAEIINEEPIEIIK